MIDALHFGEGMILDSYLPPEHWAYNVEVTGMYPYDIDRANALLEEAGWIDTNGDGVREASTTLTGEYSCRRGIWNIPAGTPFEVTFHTTTGTDYRETITQHFAEDMAAVGIKLKVEPMTAQEFFADNGPLVQRTFQISEFAWGIEPIPSIWNQYGGQNIYQTPDGEQVAAETLIAQDPSLLDQSELTLEEFLFGRPAQLPEGYRLVGWDTIPSAEDHYDGFNYPGWCSTAASQAAFDADQVLTRDERIPFDQLVQREFALDVPVLPLFQRMAIDVYSSHLCGPDRGPLQYATWNVETWYFDEDGQCDAP